VRIDISFCYRPFPNRFMGMSKALMEKCIVAKAKMCRNSFTAFCGSPGGYATVTGKA
jgi:hypothetical protein